MLLCSQTLAWIHPNTSLGRILEGGHSNVTLNNEYFLVTICLNQAEKTPPEGKKKKGVDGLSTTKNEKREIFEQEVLVGV